MSLHADFCVVKNLQRAEWIGIEKVKPVNVATFGSCLLVYLRLNATAKNM